MNPLLLVDSYKIHHTNMYEPGMTKLYSNLTPRKSRLKGVDSIVFFGLQHFILTYLIDLFNKHFFGKDEQRYNKVFKKDLINEYKRHCPVDTAHIEALWDLGYLPIEIKALEEGEQKMLSIKFSNCWEA